jgi:hypothetical protein
MILIIGTMPPPIGGVTIHVERLINHLDDIFEYKFVNLSILFAKNSIQDIIRAKIIHLHTSNVYARLFFSLFTLFKLKSILITYHGNLLRYNSFLNFLDLLSVSFCSVPIVLNKHSESIALKYNSKTRLISSFIPPKNNIPLPHNIKRDIQILNNKGRVFCTNAYNISFDAQKKEIYGIYDLLILFRNNSFGKLVISDPTGNYKIYINDIDAELTNSAYWICEDHDYMEVIRLCTASIRNTTTDGDSISVREALYLSKPIYATDVVDRPYGVITYKNITDLKELLINYKPKNIINKNNTSTVNDLLKVYKEACNKYVKSNNKQRNI